MRTNFWDSFNQGLQSGQAIWKANAERNLQGDIAKAAKTDQTVDRTDNDMVVAAAQGLAPGQMMSWDANTQSYVTPEGEQYVAKLPSYSLGGVTRNTEFSPTEVAATRRRAIGDTYLKYGLADKADELALRGQQMELGGLQLQKMKGDLADEENFRKDLDSVLGVANSGKEVMQQAQALLANGDRVGAANLVASWRSNNVPDKRMMRVNPETGLMEGSSDGGQTWVAGSGTRANVFNPGVVENMLGEIGNTVKEHADGRVLELSKKYAKSPETLAQMLDAEWRRGFEKEKFGYQKDQDIIKNGQWDQTFDLENRKLAQSVLDAERKYGLSAAELAMKGLLTNAQVNAYNASAGKDRQIGEAYGLSSKNIIYGNDGTAVTLKQGANGGVVAMPVTTADGKPFIGSPKSVGQERSKAEEAFYKYLEDNPQATPEEQAAFKRNVGLAPALDFSNPFGEPGGGGLMPSGTVTPMPRRLNVTAQRGVQEEYVTDPLTREAISVSDYKRKYGELPR